MTTGNQVRGGVLQTGLESNFFELMKPSLVALALLVATAAVASEDKMGDFSRHNWMRDRPNDLAAAYIGVLRAYGELLEVFIETPPLGNWQTPYPGIW